MHMNECNIANECKWMNCKCTQYMYTQMNAIYVYSNEYNICILKWMHQKTHPYMVPYMYQLMYWQMYPYMLTNISICIHICIHFEYMYPYRMNAYQYIVWIHVDILVNICIYVSVNGYMCQYLDKCVTIWICVIYYCMCALKTGAFAPT